MNLNGPANGLLRSVGKPAFIYGTAWKKEDTARLVHEALTAGFTAIDTAAQPRHYREDLVGAGIRAALSASALSREQLFVSLLPASLAPVQQHVKCNMPPIGSFVNRPNGYDCACLVGRSVVPQPEPCQSYRSPGFCPQPWLWHAAAAPGN